MKVKDDDTTGLLTAVLNAHKDIKTVFYLGSAVLAIDVLLVVMGKGNFASLSLASAGDAIGIVILALIGWALLQNMLVPFVSGGASSIVSSIWECIVNRLFPDSGVSPNNPNERLYVLSYQLSEEIIRQPDAARIAIFKQAQQRDEEALRAGRHMSYASAGFSLLVIATGFVPGTVIAALSSWWWWGLLIIAPIPWFAWTCTTVAKPDWIVDPELAQKIVKERRARRERENEWEQAIHQVRGHRSAPRKP